ncbi:hypothetical protein [Bosea sp. 685]|uniref:hypothetical protein n=1 Tax=Bosea sp. 685 TaxID=3080057 RepID=UPI002892F245|nr:hypothetical protein [Bosea sp. 685]WNJ88582.1 hypothetical protein RMR04_19455 [Bosea sp. 685]
MPELSRWQFMSLSARMGRQPPKSAASCGASTAIDSANAGDVPAEQEQIMAERFERHRQPWTQEELQKLKLLAGKGMALKAISKAMTRSEESIKDRAKLDGIGIAKLR